MATTTMQLDTELRDQLPHIAQRDFDGATLSEALQRLVPEHRINAQRVSPHAQRAP